jgi:hypothetical protein
MDLASSQHIKPLINSSISDIGHLGLSDDRYFWFLDVILNYLNPLYFDAILSHTSDLQKDSMLYITYNDVISVSLIPRQTTRPHKSPHAVVMH